MNGVFGSMKTGTGPFENEYPDKAYKLFVFANSFFHISLHNCKKFGKIEWITIYYFMELISLLEKDLYLNLLKIVPEDPIICSSFAYLIGENVYGLIASNDFDRCLMMTYLKEYMGIFFLM